MAEVSFHRDGHIAHVRLNRPDMMNAINDAMDDLLEDIWAEIEADPGIWCVVLSAEGERAFSIGADPDWSGSARRRALGGGLTGIGGPLTVLHKPLIAAVQGFCVGGGFELAMCADIIVAAETAQFGVPETKHGIIGECGVVHRIIRQLPHHVAMGMILTGDRIDAEAALRHGLVNETCPPEALAETASRWAAKVTAASPLANQAAKAAALGRLGYPLDVALATRFEPIEKYAESADCKESDAARREGRKARWSGC